MARSVRVTKKKIGNMLQLKTLQGGSGTYLFVKDASGSYHALIEVDTKKALRDCGAEDAGTTRQMGKRLLGF